MRFWSHYFLGQRFPSLIYFALIFSIMAISSSYRLGETQVEKDVLEKSYSEAHIFVNYLISFRFRCFYLNKTWLLVLDFRIAWRKNLKWHFEINSFLTGLCKSYSWKLSLRIISEKQTSQDFKLSSSIKRLRLKCSFLVFPFTFTKRGSLALFLSVIVVVITILRILF